MHAKYALFALLLAGAGTVSAQSGSPKAAPAASTQPTAAEQAQRAKLEQQMAQAATRVAQMIDANQIGEVWDGSSNIAKSAVPRADFIKQISTDRTTLGAVGKRTVHGVSLSQSNGSNKNLPAGIYANVVFSTTFAKSRQPVRELVSFHLDSDKTWRLAGYTLH